MISFFEAYDLIAEDAFDVAANKWKSAGNNPAQIKQAIDQLKLFKSRNLIKGPEGDIQQWAKQPFDSFNQFISSANLKFQKKQVIKSTEKAADKVFENSKVIVIVPHTYEASQKYGANTKWCTASRDTDEHWIQYRKSCSVLYYVIPKDGTGKTAVAVHPKIGSNLPGDIEVYGVKDGMKPLKDVLTKYNIPKSLFVASASWEQWIKQQNYTKNSDGSLDITADIKIDGQNLTEFNFPFVINILKGKFSCTRNKLISLEGCPKIITEDFNAEYNQLTSLRGGPIQVGDRYNVSDNKLTSLEGAAHTCGRFFCDDNRLTSLKGGPLYIKNPEDPYLGDYSCSNNLLTSLEGSPFRITGNFNCSNNPLKTLDGIPGHIKEYFISDGTKFSMDHSEKIILSAMAKRRKESKQ